MARVVVEAEVHAPVERCFDLARDIDLHRRSMEASGEQAVAGVTSGLIGPGQEVTFRARHFGVWWRLTSRIVDYDRPWRFVDQMRRGPFAAWRHEHRFERRPDGTRMVDVAEYRLPLGPLGGLVDRLLMRRHLRRLLEARQHHVKLAAEHPGVGGGQLR